MNRLLISAARTAAAAAAFAAFSGVASAATIGTADVVFVVDESGSMGGEHKFLEDVIPDLDAALAAKSIAANYAVIGYGSSAVAPRIVRNFGTAAATASGLDASLLTNGGTEDGYAGMGFALTNLTFTGDALNVILVTDEDRDDRVNCTAFGCISGAFDTFSEMLALLTGKKAVLNAVLDLNLNGGALGYDGTTSYSANGSGGFTESAGGGYSPSNSLGQDYGDMALATGGAVWDLGILRSGGFNAQSFAAGFINVKVEEIEDQITPPQPGVVPLPAAGWMLIAGLGGLAAVKRRKAA